MRLIDKHLMRQFVLNVLCAFGEFFSRVDSSRNSRAFFTIGRHRTTHNNPPAKLIPPVVVVEFCIEQSLLAARQLRHNATHYLYWHYKCMIIGRNFFTLLLFYISFVVLVQILVGVNDLIVNEAAPYNPFSNSLAVVACIIGTNVGHLGFSFVGDTSMENMWLRLLTSMLCCAMVYQIYPMLSAIVDLVMHTTPSYVLIYNGITTGESLVVMAPIVLLVGYAPCLTSGWQGQQLRAKSLDFLTVPLLMTLYATVLWVVNQLVIRTSCEYSLYCYANSYYQVLGFLQTGFLIVSACLVMYIKTPLSRLPADPPDHEYSVIKIISRFFMLGYFILLVPTRHSNAYFVKTLFCMFAGITGQFMLNYIRRLQRQPLSSEDYLEVIVSTGVASIRGLQVSPAWALLIGLVLALLTNRENFSKWKHVQNSNIGPHLIIGAIVGIYSDVSKFQSYTSYIVIMITSAMGMLFGGLLGWALTYLPSYRLEEISRPPLEEF